LIARLSELDAMLAEAPPRIRYRPLKRALWRGLLLTVPELAAVLACPPTFLRAFDLIALRLVWRAVLGNVKAISMVYDIIEGRPERRRGDARSSSWTRGKRSTAPDLDPVERARIIAELEAALGKASTS
jgi:hypothetical protein